MDDKEVDDKEVRRKLAEHCVRVLREAGFSGRGSTVRRSCGDLQWVVRVERAPRTVQVIVTVGLSLGSETAPMLNDCHLQFDVANTPGLAQGDDLARALFPGATGDSWNGRVADILDDAVRFLCSVDSVAKLRDIYMSGEFRSACLHWRMKEFLEGQGRSCDG